jgi:hypothetical protein
VAGDKSKLQDPVCYVRADVRNVRGWSTERFRGDTGDEQAWRSCEISENDVDQLEMLCSLATSLLENTKRVGEMVTLQRDVGIVFESEISLCRLAVVDWQVRCLKPLTAILFWLVTSATACLSCRMSFVSRARTGAAQSAAQVPRFAMPAIVVRTGISLQNTMRAADTPTRGVEFTSTGHGDIFWFIVDSAVNLHLVKDESAIVEKRDTEITIPGITDSV